MKKIEIKSKIANLIKNNKMFHSIILSGKNYEDVQLISKDIARIFFCINKSIEKDECGACKRFCSNNIIDFIEIGDGNLAITKAQIQDLIVRFSLTAFESFNKKVYLINTAENLKTDAANSLLKFLEEPPKNTFAILASKNKTDILPTIRSRCNYMVLESSQTDLKENNVLIELLSKSKNEILLENIKLKKMDKSELIELVESAYQTIQKKYYLNSKMCEVWLEFIQDLKFSFAKNLSIDNWLIKITEVL